MKHLLEVTSKIYELYTSSGIERKRKILKLIFPNFWLDGRNLSYDIKKPFEIFLKRSDCLLNWAGVEEIRTDFDPIFEFLDLLVQTYLEKKL